MTDTAPPPPHDPPAAHAEGPPRLTVDGHRATITLQRPSHHNRLHAEDLRVLQRHVAALAAEPALAVVVLTGLGPSFSAGFHVGDFDGDAAGGPSGPQLFEQTVDLLEALPVPTIARLNGGVFGGATDLALACDFRVGGPNVTLRMPAARLGLHYYPSGLRRYVTRLGLQAAKRLFLLAETVGAPQLHALGYLDRLAEPGRLDAEVDALAEALAAGAPLALRGMKQSLNEIARAEYHLGELRAREQACADSADLREGRAAFAEKRAPRFQGR